MGVEGGRGVQAPRRPLADTEVEGEGGVKPRVGLAWAFFLGGVKYVPRLFLFRD